MAKYKTIIGYQVLGPRPRTYW